MSNKSRTDALEKFAREIEGQPAAPTRAARRPATYNAEATALALRLAHAENALRALTLGQVDAIVSPSGQTYLLRPAQEHLQQNERRLQAMIDGAADAITVVNRGGVITSQSPAARSVLGYEPEEMVGTSIFELVHADDLPAVESAFHDVLEATQEHATARFRHRAHDGRHRLIEATIGKLRSVSSQSVVFSLRPVVWSLTADLEPARDEPISDPPPLGKDRFLAMLSHELRTPLAPALLGLGELQEDERFAEARPVLAMMRRNLELQSRLLEELTDFTSVGQEKLRLRLEAIDTHEAVRFVLEICQTEIAAAGVTVLLDLHATEHFAAADSARLQQVMWNLVKNAVKFSAPGSCIAITTANDPPGRLSIDFADHGIGIEAALLPRVFDPFQQGDCSMQQRYGGLGLGLFIAKGLAEAQEGTLTVTSEGRGKGATFRLTLPLVPSIRMEEVEPLIQNTSDDG